MKYTLILRSHEAWKKNSSCGCLKRTEEEKRNEKKKSKRQKGRNKEPKK
jgi:hypothetical protein